jgi:hypothetical protein
VANYAVLNPLMTAGSYVILSNGNLNASLGTSSTYRSVAGTISPSSKKWYAEVTVISDLGSGYLVGVAQSGAAIFTGAQYYGITTDSYGFFGGNGQKYNNTAGAAYGSTFTTGAVIGIALDLDNGAVYFSLNGTFQNSGVPTSGASKTGAAFSIPTNISYFIGVSSTSGSISAINFGQQPFTYTPPTGFNALNTYNLPTPTIANGAQYMAATTWTGNGGSQSVLNSANNTIGTTFQPDFVWMKSRGATYVSNDHNLFDVLRGVNKALFTNLTDAETTYTSRLTSFDSSGFTTGAQYNANTGTFVGWQWKANGSGVSNTNGSITSTVSANTTAGFSIVGYTGNTTSGATVGHGLGVAPSMIIIKSRTNGTDGWVIYHVSVGNTKALFFDTSTGTTQAAYWNNTSPTSSVFTLGFGTGANNTTANIAYCWAAVAGYSAFGSYTGNGSTDGPFAYVGFRPRFVLIKRTDSTGNWYIWDTSRNTYNVVGEELYPNLTNAGSTATDLDILSNGFKIRSTAADFNANGGTYVYACFSENPFNSSRAR